MKLVTFQSIKALEFVIKNKYLICNENMINKAKVGKTLYVPYSTDRKVKDTQIFSSKEKLSHKQYKEGIFITLPEIPSDCADFIIEINFK